MTTPAEVLSMLKEKEVKFVDLRFTDTRGKEQHVTVPSHTLDSAFFDDGKMFDGSSIAGWKGINESDMILGLDASTAVLDPFMEETTLNIRCDIIEPMTMQGYERDPRSAAKRAEAYMRSTGLADEAFFGPENEFFIFDDVRWASAMNGASYAIESYEGAWQSDKQIEEGNLGHRPGIKGGYFPVPPVDSLQDIRSAMCLALEEMGLSVEVHHHEVATAGQCEIGVKFGSLVRKADDVMTLKYVIHNVAHSFGKTATFMPKPLLGDNGSGMHVHQSLAKGGKNLFQGDLYGGLSQTALYYIGGIMKHAHAINALTNASTNSYKRLVKGFEAPTLLAYSARNRSASIRIPMYSKSPKAKRLEFRCPDPSCNGYLAWSAMLMSMLDGIRNKIDPGQPLDRDIYEMTRHEMREMGIKTTPGSLDEALTALEQDHAFLTQGDVFTEDLIDTWISYKREKELDPMRLRPHPHEFYLYYDN